MSNSKIKSLNYTVNSKEFDDTLSISFYPMEEKHIVFFIKELAELAAEGYWDKTKYLGEDYNNIQFTLWHPSTKECLGTFAVKIRSMIGTFEASRIS